MGIEFSWQRFSQWYNTLKGWFNAICCVCEYSCDTCFYSRTLEVCCYRVRKNSVYYKKYPNQFVKVNRSVSRFLKMKHSVVHKPLLFEMFFSIVYIVLGVINICEYYNSGCDNWIGYTSTFHRFPVLVVIDYVIFISLVLVCRKKLGNNKE